MNKFENAGFSNLIYSLFKFIKRVTGEKIIANSGIYIGGNFLQKALVFLLIPVLTRFLSLEDYGIYGLAITIESVLVILFSLGIQSSVARYYYDFQEDKERLKQYISTNYFFLLLTICLVLVIFHFSGETIWDKLTSGKIPYYPYIIMVLFSSSATIIINFATMLYQTQQNARAFVIAQSALVVLILLLTILFVVIFKLGVVGQLFGRLISTVIVAILLSIILLRDWFTVRLQLSDIKSSLEFGFPLIFHGLFAWALTSIDRMMLEPHVPLSEIGLYNLGYQIGGVLTALLISINQAWVPYYYSIMKKDLALAKQKIQLVTEIYVVLFGFICLIGMLFCKEILQIISTPRYQNAAIYVPIILFSALFNGYYFMSSTSIFYAKKTVWIPIMTGTTAFLNIGLNILWIPQYGAIGSAWATLLSYAALAVVAHLFGQHLAAIKLPLVKIFVLNVILAISMYFSTYRFIEGDWGLTIKLILLITYLLVVFFGFIKLGHISRILYNYQK
jgi:O-antigen/teichoic acid export membrane protein